MCVPLLTTLPVLRRSTSCTTPHTVRCAHICSLMTPRRACSCWHAAPRSLQHDKRPSEYEVEGIILVSPHWCATTKARPCRGAGHLYKMALAEQEGANSVDGVEALLYQVHAPWLAYGALAI